MHVVAPLAQRNSRPALQDLEAVGLRGFAEPRDVLRRSARPRRVVPNADHCDHQHANPPSAATTATPHVLYSYRARAPRATRQERQADPPHVLWRKSWRWAARPHRGPTQCRTQGSIWRPSPDLIHLKRLVFFKASARRSHGQLERASRSCPSRGVSAPRLQRPCFPRTRMLC